MKKTALLAAAAALMAATPAAANGYVGLEYDTGESSLILGQEDSEGWQGEGAVGFGGTGWGAQLNASIGSLELEDVGVDIDTRNLAGHLWWGGSGWRLGGMIASNNADAGSGLEVDETLYGIEGTFDAGSSAVLFSSVTTGSGDFLFGDYDVFNWDAGGSFYASPNMRIGAFFGFGSFEPSGGPDLDTTSYGLNGEFQFSSAPISIVAGWNSFQVDDTPIDVSMFSIGARWNFGGGTLRDRDNSTPFSVTPGVANRLSGSW